MQQFFEGKTCTYAVPGYNRAAKRGNFDLYSKPRGSPLNVGTELRATHPVVRTNPITGEKERNLAVAPQTRTNPFHASQAGNPFTPWTASKSTA